MPDKGPGQTFEKKGYYPFLDGLRGIAILWVLLHHINYFFDLEKLAGPILFRILWLGSLGVDIFFVTSGFLITGLLIGELETGVRLKRFYLRRSFKIAPQYLLTVAAGLVWAGMNNEHYSLVRIGSYFLMFQNYVLPIPGLGHLWSIAIEEHFYLVYPLILWGVCRFVRNGKERRTAVIIILCALIVLGNFLRYQWFEAKGAYADADPTIWQVTHIRFDALIFGCLLKFLEPYFCNPARRRKGLMSTGYFAVALVLFLYFIIDYYPIDWAHYTMAYIGAGCLLVCALTGFRPVRAVAENPVLRWVGKSSYGIYLWHYVLLFPFLVLCRDLGGDKQIAIVYFFSAIAVGVATTWTVERYFLNIRNRVVP